MYAPYILFGYAATLALVLIAFAIIRRSIPELRGIRPLSNFVLVALFGVILLAARNRAPALLTMAFANVLFLIGPLYIYAAAAEILDLRTRGIRWLVGLCVAGVGAQLWYSVIQPRILIRLVIHGVVVGAFFAAAAVLLFRNQDESVEIPARASAWFATTMVALQLAWLSSPWLLHTHPTFFSPDPIDAAFSYLAMLLALASGGALVWLSLCVHRRELQRVAETDSLTGLLNRGAFEVILSRDLRRAHRSGVTLGVLLIDLDYFKQVNDSYGHAVGDRVLRQMSGTLSARIRPSDVLARYGGEEFVILLRASNAEDAQGAAERIRCDVERLDEMPDGIRLTASIGVAVSLPGESPDELLLRADEALYRSKKEGRNLVTLYRSPRRSKLASR